MKIRSKVFLILLILLLILISCKKSNGDFILEVYITPPDAIANIKITPDKEKYKNGDVVTLLISNNKNPFYRWEGDVSGNELEKKVLMDENKKIIAHFKKKLDITLGDGSDPNRKGKYKLELIKKPSDITANIITYPRANKEGLYSENEEVSIFVMTINDFLVSWEGDLSGKYPDDYPPKITMDSDKKIVLNFQKEKNEKESN